MKRFFFALLLTLFVVPLALAQVRVQGEVKDPEGKPVEGARVILKSEGAGEFTPAPVTDRRGKWGALLPMGGRWLIDIEAKGFVTSRGTVQLSEVSRNPALKTTLERIPEPVAQPQPQPQEVASTVAPEAVEAVRRGEALMRQARGEALIQTTDAEGKAQEQVQKGEPPPEAERKRLHKEAVVEFEKAQALLPDHIQLKQVLAQAYYQSGELKPAVALLKDVHKADPTNVGVLLLLINLLLEDGELEEGRALLEKVPEGTMSDPTALVNIGILFLNKGNPQDAHAYFEKAVTIDAQRGETYYYRGLAALQMKKMNTAKADFERAIALAPGSSEAEDARALLKQMK